jgi:hypothetical protein
MSINKARGTEMATKTTTQVFTDSEATDEAVLLFTRKLMRMHPEAYADVIKRLPDGARQALALAETRADRVRDADQRAATTHRYMTDDERYGEITEE